MKHRRPERNVVKSKDLFSLGLKRDPSTALGVTGLGRRTFIAGATLVTVLPLGHAHATSADLDAAIKQVTGGATLQPGRITLNVPPLVENGNTVPLTVSVESPMTEADHVKAIHVFNEKNPQPHVFSAVLGPRNAKAVIGTRIKLADTQKIVGIAEMSNGAFWTASANVIVTIAACIEEVN
jgi:sulfur-oxidizing protein SoxY